VKIRRALISVTDKTGLEDLAKTLHSLGVEIISTGGTAKKIKEIGVPVKDISDHTGFPEMMDGRVKTLHPKVHGGLLALRDSAEHMAQAKEHNIIMIDMVVVNLYPFEKTVAKPGVKLEEAIENIDIGGPSMIRSASKNYKFVAVLTDPAKYPEIIKELKETEGSLSENTLKNLAVQAFRRTSSYDTAIYNYLKGPAGGQDFADNISLSFEKIQDLRYGENPHQKAAFYRTPGTKESGICSARQLQGKELSFNNIMDLNAAIEIVKDFDEPAACIIKHNNPCGAATAKTLSKAYLDALDCDRLSAFGSIVGFNGRVDKELASTILKEADFVECIIAPGFDAAALELFAKKKNLRLLEVPNYGKTSPSEKDYKKVVGGLLMQDIDKSSTELKDLKTVTGKKPGEEELKALLFGWKIVRHVKSNAIILCSGTKTVGIGAGQMSRVDSVKIAVEKAGAKAKGSVLASDAFFPKEDNVEEAHKAGITAVIQPGGSIKDNDVITACNKLGIAMVFTGVRHFKH